MKQRLFESLVGIIVLMVCGAFFYKIHSLNKAGSILGPTIVLKARFSNIEGVWIGTPVKIGGVKVGSVTNIFLDEDLTVNVNILIQKSHTISIDSSIAIVSSGLLGSKYIEIIPGADDEEEMKDGDYFRSTKSTVSIEGLISKFAFGKRNKE